MASVTVEHILGTNQTAVCAQCGTALHTGDKVRKHPDGRVFGTQCHKFTRGGFKRRSMPSAVALTVTAVCAQCGAKLPAGSIARVYRNGAVYGVSCHETRPVVSDTWYGTTQKSQAPANAAPAPFKVTSTYGTGNAPAPAPAPEPAPEPAPSVTFAANQVSILAELAAIAQRMSDHAIESAALATQLAALTASMINGAAAPTFKEPEPAQPEIQTSEEPECREPNAQTAEPANNRSAANDKRPRWIMPTAAGFAVYVNNDGDILPVDNLDRICDLLKWDHNCTSGKLEKRNAKGKLTGDAPSRVIAKRLLENDPASRNLVVTKDGKPIDPKSCINQELSDQTCAVLTWVRW